MHEVSLPQEYNAPGEKYLSVPCTFITEEYELFAVVETQYRYVIYQICLLDSKSDYDPDPYADKNYKPERIFMYEKKFLKD